MKKVATGRPPEAGRGAAAGAPVDSRRPVTRNLSARVRLAVLRLVGIRYHRSGGLAPAAQPRSVLLIRPDHLGDLLFLTPALRALREAWPQARLTLLAGPWGSEAVRSNPDLDAVRLCSFPGFERRPKTDALAPYRLLAGTAAALQEGDFDLAVVSRYDHWWGAWLAAAAGIPRRLGYAWPETRPFLTETVSYEAGHHEVVQNGRLLDAIVPGLSSRLGPLRYEIAAEDVAWAGDWLAERGYVAGRPLIAVHPGAGAAVKQWPPENWAEVASGLVKAYGAQILLTGGPAERDLTAAVAERLEMPAIDGAGQTTLGQLAALQAGCALVLGSDSGPLHLAVAAGAPTLHLYGPVAPAKFGPWGDPHRQRVIATPWVCAPCDRLDWDYRALAAHACMAGIRPDVVLSAAQQMLAGEARARQAPDMTG